MSSPAPGPAATLKVPEKQAVDLVGAAKQKPTELELPNHAQSQGLSGADVVGQTKESANCQDTLVKHVSKSQGSPSESQDSQSKNEDSESKYDQDLAHQRSAQAEDLESSKTPEVSIPRPVKSSGGILESQLFKVSFCLASVWLFPYLIQRQTFLP